MRTKDARYIRTVIMFARQFGWSRPPRMYQDRYRGLQYVDERFGRIWERTMRGLGKYPPPPPLGDGGVSTPKRQEGN